MSRRPLTLVLALVLGLAACGGGDGEGGTAEGGSGGIRIAATEFAFDPASVDADAGSVSFELVNEGGAPHALAIEGNGVDESSETIEGGAETTLEVELADGTYEIYCPVGDHRERGMVGTLTVGAGGATTGGETGTDGETDTGETGTDAETETDDSSGSGSGSGSDDAFNY